ncbi:MAG: CofH family radical SAM protein [Candidatus Brocadiia bacterium]
MDPKVILKAVNQGQEISPIEAVVLMQSYPTHAQEIHEVANNINKRIHRNVVSFAHSKHIAYTNVCRYSCKYCSFYRKKKDRDSFTLGLDEILKKIKETPDIHEVCIYGGLNGSLQFQYYCTMLKEIRKNFPGVTIKAFSPQEIFFMVKRSKQTVSDVLKQLKESGLDSLHGMDADILNDKLRKKICPDKVKTIDWIDIIKTAHRLGIRTSATILFGHLENEIHIAEHLEIIREIQHETNGFLEFTPLPFGEHNRKLPYLEKLLKRGNREDYFGGEETVVRLIAISRIFFQNTVKTIQANWFRLGMDNALKGLQTGANDLGETEYDISATRSLKRRNQTEITPAKLKQTILRTGKVPRLRKQ